MESNDDNEPFLYTGQSREDIPRNVRHVRVDPAVKEIDLIAFMGCRQLIKVELNEGLESIDGGAFIWCGSLMSIIIPSTVKEIGSLAFSRCSELRNVELCEGLEEIKSKAFAGCTSLQRISIPSTVKEIGEEAFRGCSGLKAIEFCNEIEQFVNEASLHWWNHGVSEASLITYSFLARCHIPARLGTIRAQTLKNDIHNMLRRIPEQLDDLPYYDSIESRLANYVYLQEVAPFLELALWKVKITEQQSSGNLVNDDMKMLCRRDSISMFVIIFPNVLSFLSVDAE
jgi:hypothetical protein